MAYNAEIKSNELPLHMTARMNFKCVTTGFLSLTTIDIWGQIRLCCGSCPMQHPQLYPPDASRISTTTPFRPPNHVDQKCLQTLPNVPYGAKSPPAEHHCMTLSERSQTPKVCSIMWDSGKGKTRGADKGSVVFRGWCWGETDCKEHGTNSRKCPISWLWGWARGYVKVYQLSQSCTQTQQMLTKHTLDLNVNE